MNRFGVKPTPPKALFGMKPEKRKGAKFLLVGETDECKVNFLTQLVGKANLNEGHIL